MNQILARSWPESITKAPVINHFSETVQGVITIRSFRKGESFFQENLNRLNSSLKMDFHNNGANEWLGFRLELLGSSVLCFTALLMVTLPRSFVKQEFVALSLSYGLSLNSIFFYVTSALFRRSLVACLSLWTLSASTAMAVAVGISQLRSRGTAIGVSRPQPDVNFTVGVVGAVWCKNCRYAGYVLSKNVAPLPSRHQAPRPMHSKRMVTRSDSARGPSPLPNSQSLELPLPLPPAAAAGVAVPGR
ncbi:hypothetical protein QYE76_038063 [Lolium multiflorum]|uniref:ABC transmembrane type-1 domain-containing protein n=1 Tax=Lolium multiflorum TaxID=4521 RepID=A0AAD8T795_LOLMU|nr:hypothetical protein QYE76_038063 [Lolium multiflorum]